MNVRPSIGSWLLLAAMGSLAVYSAPVRVQGGADSGANPTFRVNTRLVQVDVVVRDASGPVDGLTADDFRLFEDGQERTIGFFEVTRSEPAEARPAPVRTMATNRPEEASEGLPTGATILLLDRLNTEILDQPRANAQALEFLASLDGSQSVAIYELRGQLRLIQDYTSDREELVEAARSLETESSSQLRASYGTNATGGFEATGDAVGLDPDLVDARTGGGIEERGTADLDQQVAAFYMNNRIRVTAEVLESLARHMSGLAGRKSLIWISGRFPFSFEPRSSFLPEEISTPTIRRVEETARALTDANVAVYPVSAVGLLAPSFNDPSVSPTASVDTRRRAAFSRSISTAPDRLTNQPVNTNSMRQIAEMTGGEAYYWTNGIAEAIGEAVADSELVYTVGFYPDSNQIDSEFHTLRIEVARDDVNVMHRRGYYGFDTPAAAANQDPEPITELVASPVNATAIGLQAIPDSDGSTRLTVNLGNLDMMSRDDIWYAAVEIATLMVSAGETGNIETGNLVVAVTDPQRRTANAGAGYELFRVRPGEADAAWFRVVVRDLISGRAGSMWVFLE